MREEQLRELMQRADVDVDLALPAQREMSRRVRELDARRRRRARLVVTGAAMLLAGAAVGWAAWPAGLERNEGREVAVVPRHGGEDARLPPPPQGEGQGEGSRVAGAFAANAPDGIEQLAAEAEFHLRIARRMIADRDDERAAARRRRELAQPDPMDVIRERLDMVAFRMICEADRLRAAMQPSEEATAIYRDVIRLFPTTNSAELARQRLGDPGKS